MKRALLALALCLCAGVAQATVYQFDLQNTNDPGDLPNRFFETPTNSITDTPGKPATAGVPEPAIWVLGGLGIAALIVFRRRD